MRFSGVLINKIEDKSNNIGTVTTDTTDVTITLTVEDNTGIIKTDTTTANVLESMPDLLCEGNLQWTNVKQGTTVNGIFTVRNNSESKSKLDWKVESYPEWGTWTFTPSEGSGLTPEEGIITVQVTLVAHKIKSRAMLMDIAEDKDYTGKIIVVNTDNADDYCEIPVTMTVSKSKIFTYFDFYRILIYHFYPYRIWNTNLRSFCLLTDSRGT